MSRSPSLASPLIHSEPCTFCHGTGQRYSGSALAATCLCCRGTGSSAAVIDAATAARLDQLQLVRAAAGYGGGNGPDEAFA